MIENATDTVILLQNISESIAVIGFILTVSAGVILGLIITRYG